MACTSAGPYAIDAAGAGFGSATKVGSSIGSAAAERAASTAMATRMTRVMVKCLTVLSHRSACHDPHARANDMISTFTETNVSRRVMRFIAPRGAGHAIV